MGVYLHPQKTNVVTETARLPEMYYRMEVGSVTCGTPEDSHLGYQAGLELMDCGRKKSQGQTEVERRCSGPMCHVAHGTTVAQHGFQ